MSRILQKLIGEGYGLDEKVMGALRPYLTGHINRFGDSRLVLLMAIAMTFSTLKGQALKSGFE